MKYLIIPIFFCLIFFSCEEGEKNRVIEISRVDFADSLSVSGQVVKFDSILNPFFFHILRDTILLVENKTPAPFYFSAYNLNSKKKILDFAERGRGPDEFLSAHFMANDYTNISKYILIRDVVKKSVSKYDLDALVNSKGTCKPVQHFEFPYFMEFFSKWNDDTYICYNPFFIDNKKYTNNNERLFLYDVISKLPNTIDHNYFTSNVSGGEVLSNYSNENVIVANRYQDHIYIYDKNLEIQQIINGPDGIVPQYRVEDKVLLFKKGGYQEAYISSFQTKNYIFLVYAKGQNAKFWEPKTLEPVEVFKLNWEGKLIKRYSLDWYIYSISITSDDENIYGTGLNDDGEIKLVHFNLNTP